MSGLVDSVKSVIKSMFEDESVREVTSDSSMVEETPIVSEDIASSDKEASWTDSLLELIGLGDSEIVQRRTYEKKQDKPKSGVAPDRK